MIKKRVTQEVASSLRRTARDMEIAAGDLRVYADQLDPPAPPDLPQASQASHHSG
jgi:hypothetical protein